MSPDTFLRPDWPASPTVHALVTTRLGGVSHPPYDSFNLGSHVGDDPHAVARNRRSLARHLPAEPFWLDQIHGCEVVAVDTGRVGVRADASVARQPGQVCAILTADCLPVLFCDRDGCVVAAAHAGWRGLCAGVLERSVAAMGVPAASILAWLGPAIGPAAFEVGDEVRRAFLEAGPVPDQAFVAVRPGHWHADLYALARARLLACGVKSIYGGGRCTFGEAQSFYSYRREGRTGRMASLVWLQPRC